MPPTNCTALAARAHAASVEKGFDPPRWADEYGPHGAYLPANYLAKMMLIVTELVELLDAPNETNAAEELADIVLRALPVLYNCAPADALEQLSRRVDTRKRPLPFGWQQKRENFNVLGPAIRDCCVAAEAWRKDDVHAASEAVQRLVLYTFYHADAYDIDLVAAVEAKLAKNAARPYRHGKKAAG